MDTKKSNNRTARDKAREIIRVCYYGVVCKEEQAVKLIDMIYGISFWFMLMCTIFVFFVVMVPR